MRRLRLYTVIGIACALCFGARAGERAAPDAEARAVEAPGAIAPQPLDEAQLSRLRGRMASPADLRQAGVVLWDEPRKSMPPIRSGGEATSGTNVTTSFTIHYRAP